MKIEDCKFTEQEFSGKTISELSDRPNETGMTATELKARFDVIGKTMIALGKFNKLVDLLLGNATGDSAAEQIGSSEIAELNDPAVPTQKAVTIWGQIKSIVTLLTGHTGDVSNPHNVTKTQVGLSDADNTSDANKPISTAQKAALDLKLDAVLADNLIDTVEFSNTNGIFTFHRHNGTSFAIDTVLEKVPISCRLDGTDFVLVLEDGTEQRVSLAHFVDVYSFADTPTIHFTKSPTENAYTATIPDGAITREKLDTAVMGELNTLEQSARTSATTATSKASESSDSATKAKASEVSAGQSATTATTKASEADSSSISAKASESASGSSATTSQSYAVGGTGSRAGEDMDNSKYYMEQARAIVTGDYATRTEAQGYVTTHNADSTSHSGLFNRKVDKIQGKGLSTNDYTSDDLNKLKGIADGATKTEISVSGSVLSPGNWDAQKTINLTYTHPTARAIVGLAQEATKEEREAAVSAEIIAKPGIDGITISCMGDVPKIKIPVVILSFE